VLRGALTRQLSRTNLGSGRDRSYQPMTFLPPLGFAGHDPASPPRLSFAAMIHFRDDPRRYSTVIVH
jgi:hypothetical protein